MSTLYGSILTNMCQAAIIEDMEKHRKGTTLRLTEQDIQAVLKIRQYYGIASDNQAIILALNIVARQIEEGRASPPVPKQGTAHSSPV